MRDEKSILLPFIVSSLVIHWYFKRLLKFTIIKKNIFVTQVSEGVCLCMWGGGGVGGKEGKNMDLIELSLFENYFNMRKHMPWPSYIVEPFSLDAC